MARTFDGTDDNVSFGDLAGLDGLAALTVTFWVNALTLEDWANFVGKLSSTDGWGIQCGAAPNWGGNDDLFVSARNASANQWGYTTGGFVAANTWTHVAYVFDGAQATDATKLVLYTQGTARTLTFQGTALPTTLGVNTAPVQVGRFGTDVAANCSIEDVRCYDVALIAQEVGAVMRGQAVRMEHLLLWANLFGVSSPEPNIGSLIGNGTVTGAVRGDGPPGRGFPMMTSRRIQRVPVVAGGDPEGSLLGGKLLRGGLLRAGVLVGSR